MTFVSILFDKEGARRENPNQPDFFSDLNLDLIVDAITSTHQQANLKPFFYSPLQDTGTVYYRHEAMRDIENPSVSSAIREFNEKMVIVRRYLNLIERLDYDYHRKGWFLEAALVYCDAVTHLAQQLEPVEFKSRAFQEFREVLIQYVRSPAFQSLQKDSQKVKEALLSIKYCIIVQRGKFSVRKYLGETDYTVDVEKTFAKFKEGATKEYLIQLPERSGMGHVEAKILEFVARLFPEPFSALDQFSQNYPQFIDETLRAFDREVQFYLAYQDFISDFKARGFPFCYPQVSPSNKEVFAVDSFDLALANTLFYSEKPLVCNDFYLQGAERIIVVTGPNQGGKTTFARMFGQLHYLASLGCPVPGREARLLLPDQIFTHFERQEDIHNLRGKLHDDLFRIYQALRRATPQSLFILNEIFSSTTLVDSLFLSKEIMKRALELDVLCVWVTFLDELSSYSEKVVSMVSTVSPKDPNTRTFKIIRKQADGLAFAMSLAEKHRLTYRQLKKRLKA